MAQIALSLSVTLGALNFAGASRGSGKLFPGSSGGLGTNSFRFSSSRVKGIRCAVSSSSNNNGGVAEISENELAKHFYAWPDYKKPRVCILGGGFGGLYTALRLESLYWPDNKKPQVVLVDQSEHFVFKPMLYELLSGEVDAWEVAPRFSDLLANTSIQFIQDKVKLVDPCDHYDANNPKNPSCSGTVYLESGLHIEYDWLVLALGAEAKLDLVPGAAEYALPFSTLSDAQRVDSQLKILERINFSKKSLIRVAVVGCGYSGVELAATISERLQDRGLVQAINMETMICPTAPPGNREAALKVLSSRNVELLLGYIVRSIQRVDDAETTEEVNNNRPSQGTQPDLATSRYRLELQPTERGSQGRILEADLVLWTVGSKSLLPTLEPSENYRKQLPLNGRGQAETDETLRVRGHPRIFALGDSSALRDSNGRPLPATAQVAFQQADFAGWNLWAAINNRPLLPFRYQNLGEMMTLGRNDASVSPSFIEGLTLEGPIGHAARKMAYLIRLPTDEHRVKVGISWLTKSAVDSIATIQTTLTNVFTSQ
ncbi:hypothetical protein IC575_019985 [Cucumis melo]|uniref:demethylphylloquinone reductase n=1 Tax=Cucumis melo TaxID=3656 RepID=A0A1S3B519_CUCME|nr:alternative NAD(P)H-ubiquinone oxidoreductase C1, chloroplastic/mitochondrial isoform X1 [Cucumis melo]